MRLENDVLRTLLHSAMMLSLSCAATWAQQDDPFAQEKGSAANGSADPFHQAADPNHTARQTAADMTAHWQAKHRRVKARLEQPTEYEFYETPLEEALTHLEQKHDIQFSIDDTALENIGHDSSLPINQTMADVSLRQSLDLMLGRHGLTFFVREGIVIVTTPEEAEEALVTKTYSVRDLLHKEHPSESMDRLMDAISACVAPNSWEQVGGSGAMRAYQGILIVDQIDRVHDDVANVLRALRSDILAAGGPTIPLAQRSNTGAPGDFSGEEPR